MSGDCCGGPRCCGADEPKEDWTALLTDKERAILYDNDNFYMEEFAHTIATLRALVEEIRGRANELRSRLFDGVEDAYICRLCRQFWVPRHHEERHYPHCPLALTEAEMREKMGEKA